LPLFVLPKPKNHEGRGKFGANVAHASMVTAVMFERMPAGRLTYSCKLDDNINWPLKKTPAFGSVPFHAAPPIESPTVVPTVR